MPMPVKISDGERCVSLDRNTNALNIVNYEHHEIHGGSTYRAGARAESLANNSTLSLEFLTPSNGKQAHMVLTVSTENAADILFLEDVNVTSNGSAVTPRNANRNFGDGSSMQFMFKDSTVTTDANTITLGNRHIGAEGSGPSRPGSPGDQASRGEWVLKENTWYQLEMTNVAGATQDIHMGLDWYEHTPKSS